MISLESLARLIALGITHFPLILGAPAPKSDSNSAFPHCPEDQGKVFRSPLAYFMIECNTDRGGIDFPTNPHAMSTYKNCLEFCGEQPDCMGVSYIDSTKLCYLKSSYGPNGNNTPYAWGANRISEFENKKRGVEPVEGSQHLHLEHRPFWLDMHKPKFGQSFESSTATSGSPAPSNLAFKWLWRNHGPFHHLGFGQPSFSEPAFAIPSPNAPWTSESSTVSTITGPTVWTTHFPKFVTSTRHFVVTETIYKTVWVDAEPSSSPAYAGPYPTSSSSLLWPAYTPSVSSTPDYISHTSESFSTPKHPSYTSTSSSSTEIPTYSPPSFESPPSRPHSFSNFATSHGQPKSLYTAYSIPSGRIQSEHPTASPQDVEFFREFAKMFWEWVNKKEAGEGTTSTKIPSTLHSAVPLPTSVSPPQASQSAKGASPIAIEPAKEILQELNAVHKSKVNTSTTTAVYGNINADAPSTTPAPTPVTPSTSSSPSHIATPLPVLGRPRIVAENLGKPRVMGEPLSKTVERVKGFVKADISNSFDNEVVNFLATLAAQEPSFCEPGGRWRRGELCWKLVKVVKDKYRKNG